MSRGSRSMPSGSRGLNYATSPLLASKTPPWRSRFIVALVGLGSLVLLGRAVWIQIANNDFYLKQGEKRYAHTLSLPASRGRIFDRNGVLLATSVPAPSLWVAPKEFQADAAQRRELSRLLRLKPGELDDRLESSSGFVWLRRQVDDEAAAQAMKLGIKGLNLMPEYRRKYPEGEAAAHIVGFTDIDDRGKEGVELGFDKDLRGRDGSRFVVKDRLGRVVEEITEQTDPQHGRDLQLSIDAKVQSFAYQRVRDAVMQHGAKAGSVVVLDAQRGEVLALANYPSYDPGQRANLSGEQLRNRALTDIFEPGSTMKPFSVSVALETGRVKPDTPVQTAPGRLQMYGHTISDVHAYGVLTVAEVIKKSSNVGTVKLAMQLQPREMWELLAQVGLGQKPQIDFPGAVTGRLRPYKSWKPIEQATMSYGYGLSASLFQLARAYTVFARDGEVIPVTMLRRDADDANAPVPGQRVLSAQTARTMREMLQAAAGPGGTGPLAQTVGYSVGGKSGTARKQEGRSYTAKYRAWFVGLAPVKDPRIIVAVMVDEPSKGVFYGGAVAAPVFSQVVQQTLRVLNVPPDIDVPAHFVSKPVVSEPESF